MRTPRIFAALVLSLSCGLGSAACVQRPGTTQEPSSDEASNELGPGADESGAEEDPSGSTADPINEACLQACLAANQRAVDLCMRLRKPGARRVCIEAANVVMAGCIAACPDD
jgi:hypothetical protein